MERKMVLPIGHAVGARRESEGRARPDDSTRTVLVALGAGLGVTLAKVGAAVFTGSTALAAEAAPCTRLSRWPWGPCGPWRRR